MTSAYMMMFHLLKTCILRESALHLHKLKINLGFRTSLLFSARYLSAASQVTLSALLDIDALHIFLKSQQDAPASHATEGHAVGNLKREL